MLNSGTTDGLVREVYELQEMMGLKASKIRNEKICENFREASMSYKAKRILTIFGLDHRYYLNDYASKLGIHVLEIGDWYSPPQTIRVDHRIVTLAISHLIETRNTLSERLAQDHYSRDYQKRLSGKIEAFDNWINALTRLQ